MEGGCCGAFPPQEHWTTTFQIKQVLREVAFISPMQEDRMLHILSFLHGGPPLSSPTVSALCTGPVPLRVPGHRTTEPIPLALFLNHSLLS